MVERLRIGPYRVVVRDNILTDDLPAGKDGGARINFNANTGVARIDLRYRPEYANDPILRAHELQHVEDYKKILEYRSWHGDSIKNYPREDRIHTRDLLNTCSGFMRDDADRGTAEEMTLWHECSKILGRTQPPISPPRR